jgi:hypothetical protein
MAVGIALGAVFGLGGCAEQADDVGSDLQAAAQSENGLAMNGLAMNGLSMNGLAMNGLAMNGLAMNGLAMNGLATVDGLSSTSGLMTTSGGRDIVKYMVKCALPNGRSISKQDNTGAWHTFQGAIGVAPELEGGPCGVTCQERVSACMLAHVNNAGTNIDIWIDSEGAIGWGTSPNFPYQEGSFFGNLFPTSWQGFYCNGRGYDAGSVPGRLGTPLANNVYTNPYGGNVECGQSGQCSAHGIDGYDSCNTGINGVYKTWTKVVTVWRNFDVNTVYKICAYGTGKCLAVAGASTADNAVLEEQSYTGAAHQKFWVLQTTAGKYKVVNVNSGKAMEVSGSIVRQKTYSGTSAQQAAFNTLGNTSSQFGRYTIVPSSGTAGLQFASNAEGTDATTTTNLTFDGAKWTVVPVGTQASGGGGGGGSNPCASFCSSPTVFNGANYSSGNLGTGAICRETTTSIGGGGRYNMAGRSFAVNGVAMSGDGSITLPAKVNGGYCFQVGAGGLSYASFGTW